MEKTILARKGTGGAATWALLAAAAGSAGLVTLGGMLCEAYALEQRVPRGFSIEATARELVARPSLVLLADALRGHEERVELSIQRLEELARRLESARDPVDSAIPQALAVKDELESPGGLVAALRGAAESFRFYERRMRSLAEEPGLPRDAGEADASIYEASQLSETVRDLDSRFDAIESRARDAGNDRLRTSAYYAESYDAFFGPNGFIHDLHLASQPVRDRLWSVAGEAARLRAEELGRAASGVGAWLEQRQRGSRAAGDFQDSGAELSSVAGGTPSDFRAIAWLGYACNHAVDGVAQIRESAAAPALARAERGRTLK